MTYDIAVIGAGVIGCAVARKAGREGARVVVLDRDEQPRSASWAAAGMLAPHAESDSSGEFLSLLLRARAGFPTFVESLAAETSVPIAYRADGLLLLALNEADEADLDERFAWQAAAGLEVVRLTGSEARTIEPAITREVHSALLFPGDHQVENRQLHAALRQSAALAGGEFRLGEAVTGIQAGSEVLRVEMGSGSHLAAKVVVLAAGSWSGEIAGLPRPLPVTPVHGQLLAIDSAEPFLRHIIATPRGYLVPRSGGRAIVGATSERVGFREGTTLAGLRQLASIALEISPSLEGRPVAAHWGGFRPGTPDDLPILGADPDVPSLIYATGHYRNGILLAPITGEIIGGLAVGGQTDADLFPYRPDRFREPDSAELSEESGGLT
jgi:glycine oxidase